MFRHCFPIALLLAMTNSAFAEFHVIVLPTPNYQTVRKGESADIIVLAAILGDPNVNSEEIPMPVEWQRGDCTVPAGVAVVKLKVTEGTFRIVLGFEDNFHGRSRFRMGVGEKATVRAKSLSNSSSYKVTSVNVFGADVGVEKNTAGDYVLTAGGQDGFGFLTVRAKDNKDWYSTTEMLMIEIVAPQRVRQVKLPPVPIILPGWVIPNPNPDNKLIQPGRCAVGMQAASYLLPTDVSFHRIHIGEGTCRAVGTAGLSFATGEKHPPWDSIVSGGDVKNGCLVLGPNAGYPPWDGIVSTATLNVPAGSFTWNIPWEYRYLEEDKTLQSYRFCTLRQQAVYDGKGKVTLSKAGNTVEHTSPLPPSPNPPSFVP